MTNTFSGIFSEATAWHVDYLTSSHIDRANKTNLGNTSLIMYLGIPRVLIGK